MKIYQQLLTNDKISELLEYHRVVDHRTDTRPDVVSKHPRWDVDEWPQHIIKSVLDQVLDYDYSIEEVIFNQSRISFRLHADSGNGDLNTLGNAVIIPLMIDGPSATVFFNNHWHGASTKFSKTLIQDYEYNLLDRNGQLTHVQDLRALLHQCLCHPDSVNIFEVSNEFIDTLKYLINARENKAISKTDNRCYDYSDILNYQPDQTFPEHLHQRYLDHIPIENLHGLSIDTIADWVVGDVMVFDRTQIHCAATGHREKIGITVFTQRQ
jgi:hypothetical protein